jgi:hypothetical protein
MNFEKGLRADGVSSKYKGLTKSRANDVNSSPNLKAREDLRQRANSLLLSLLLSSGSLWIQ